MADGVAAGDNPGMRVYRNTDVALSDLISTESDLAWIRDAELHDCVVIGPGVLMMVSDLTVSECTLDTKQLWAIDANRGYLGGIGLDRVGFYGCRFRNVGFAGTHDILQRFYE